MTQSVQIIQNEQAARQAAQSIRRVAAYCRVSTDLEQQQSSLETQMTSFRSYIDARPGWKLVDIYADEGLTATSTKRRAEFNRMIADCEAGKIDYIVTKSISRFARNTVDCLQYVRKLKDAGIFIYFEKERLDTATASSEMLISILAAFAQEESHSISENLKWGYRKRFQAGEPKWSKTYGLKRDEAGHIIPIESEAEVVKRIFALYAGGKSLPQIISILEADNIPAPCGGKWWVKPLANMLRNEKYVGDLMMQKTYVVDHLSHNKVKNDQTVVPSYYVKDHHPGIVDRKTYDQVQTILSLKDRHKGSVQYPYYGTLICPICGAKMVHFTVPASRVRSVWMCGGADGKSCMSYCIEEKYIDRLMMKAYAGLTAETLEPLTRKRNTDIAETAKAALAWKAREPKLKTVEYKLLDDLVEKITFSKWDEGVVKWKFGQSSTVHIDYDRVTDIPEIKIERTDNGYMAGGERLMSGNQALNRINRLKSVCGAVRIEADKNGRPRVYTRHSVAKTDSN